MKSRLFVFRHAETKDNARGIFSGWRDTELTAKGLLQSQAIKEQLKKEHIDCAFTSHLKRARKTLRIVLEEHPDVPVITDDRLIERCYGLLQGTSKKKLEKTNPDWYIKVHRGYDFPPPKGESLKMVENRTLPFITQLNDWLKINPSNVAISCHGNSMRPIRRFLENLTLQQMLQLENSQDCAMSYSLKFENTKHTNLKNPTISDWKGILIPNHVRLATDNQNPMKKYYKNPSNAKA
jgi:2,3-bisphosphoglycerate-dependent phosphoglycerate mutase